MWSNYFKIAFRSLLRFKGYAVINLVGLALGLAAGILILIYVLDELSYDKFHTKADRIYRVGTDFISPTSNGLNSTNGWPIGHILRDQYPEIESVIYSTSASALLVNFNGKHIRQQMHFVSPEFFDVFTFPFREGNSKTALVKPFTVVISRAMEEKYFGGENALDKTITLGDTLSFLVTGIMENIPLNSHIQADMFVSFATFENLNKSFSISDGWGNINMRNYILLKEGANVDELRSKAANIYMENVGPMMQDWGVKAYVAFEPLKDIYLRTERGNGMGPLGSIDRVYLVSGIALFVILLACINFINLTTARSVYRSKEVGLRKVVGSSRGALIRQFLTESFLLTSLALFVAFALAGMLLPLVNDLLGKQYALSILLKPSTLTGTMLLVGVVTILAGYYPAIIMSGLKPAYVLKGKIQHSTKGVNLRRSLVIFQFIISVALVLGTLIVIDQLNYMRKQELGFAKDEIFIVNAARVRSANPSAFETFKNEAKKFASVEEVTFTNALPGSPGWMGQVAYPEGATGESAVSVEYIAVDDAYVQTLELSLLAGQDFRSANKAELEDGLILNETAAKQFGWLSPEEAIGKKITSPSGYPAGKVIGVIKDYHQKGLQEQIGPLAMDYNPASSYLYAIRFKAKNTGQLINDVGTLWARTFPGYDFNYSFLDADFEKQYLAEEKLASVFGFFSFATIVIAVIGLLGLISFMIASRTKEIGVRKVLGANVLQITSLLSKEFLILVIIANAIACPMVWYFADKWLDHFATRIDVSIGIFLVTLILATGITMITIGYQTVKAAMTDPVKSLRYE